jgi:hypothetical protein
VCESTLRLIQGLAIIFGGLWTLGVFTYGRIDLVRARSIEARKPFLQMRLQYYAEAALVASVIATSVDTESVNKAVARFWELYWGHLALFEDKHVESAMVDFKNVLVRAHTQVELQNSALALAHACRNSLAKMWSVELSKSELGMKTGEPNREAAHFQTEPNPKQHSSAL